MLEVLRTTSLSQAEALQVALDAAGIEAVISNVQAVGIIGGGVTVHVVNDGDVERALAVKASLEATRPSSDWRRDLSSGRRGIVRLFLGLMVIFVAVLAAREVSGWVTAVPFAAGIGLIAWGWSLMRAPGTSKQPPAG